MNLLLQLYFALTLPIPGWLQTPIWYRPLTRALGHFIHNHQALGLFGIIFAEELGLPLPAPGDVTIAFGGYLTTTHTISLAGAYAAVIAGATLGSTGLYLINRRFGHPFLLRYGRYIGFDQARFERMEALFQRWGPWAVIVGRHIPGMRIYLSALAGIFEVPLKIFVPCVMISSAAWAFIFITIGRMLGRRTIVLFRLVPAHLLPWGIGLVFLGIMIAIALERGWHPFGPRPPEPAEAPNPQPDFHKT